MGITYKDKVKNKSLSGYGKFVCPICSANFGYKMNYTIHVNKCKNSKEAHIYLQKKLGISK